MLFFFVLMHSNAYAQQTDIDELLELDISDLMEIKVISASKTIQTINEVPATVRVVTAKQIKERGYFSLECRSS
jgi:outer membrane receptor for ferrienterochelin and colicin